MTLIPTHSLRWRVTGPYFEMKVLEQMFFDPFGKQIWIAVPFVDEEGKPFK